MDEATNSLLKEGLPKETITNASQYLNREGKSFTLWILLDALTHENVSLAFAGDRLEADVKSAKRLNLALWSRALSDS